MSSAFGRVRVFFEYDAHSWFMQTGTDDSVLTRALASTDLVSAESEAVSGVTGMGFTLVSGWKPTGDGSNEAGVIAVYAEQGASADTKTHLHNIWTAHKQVLTTAGIDSAALTPQQRTLLITQNILLSGILKLLMDKGLITGEDIDTACSAVSAVDSSWMTP